MLHERGIQPIGWRRIVLISLVETRVTNMLHRPLCHRSHLHSHNSSFAANFHSSARKEEIRYERKGWITNISILPCIFSHTVYIASYVIASYIFERDYHTGSMNENNRRRVNFFRVICLDRRSRARVYRLFFFFFFFDKSLPPRRNFVEPNAFR